MNKLILILTTILFSASAQAYSGYFLSVGMNPSGQRLSNSFGSTQDIIGGGGELELGKRRGGFEYSGVLSVSSGEAKGFRRTIEGINHRFSGESSSIGLGMRLKYRTNNNFYLFVTPQLRAVVIEDDGANDPDRDSTPVEGQIHNFEEAYLGYGGDVGIGYLQQLNNGFVEDVYYQLSYSVNNYLKNYGEYRNGEAKRKINRSVGSDYYDQSILLTVGFTFGDSIVERSKEAYQAVKNRW
jgi:hypothetical protein